MCVEDWFCQIRSQLHLELQDLVKKPWMCILRSLLAFIMALPVHWTSKKISSHNCRLLQPWKLLGWAWASPTQASHPHKICHWQCLAKLLTNTRNKPYNNDDTMSMQCIFHAINNDMENTFVLSTITLRSNFGAINSDTESAFVLSTITRWVCEAILVLSTMTRKALSCYQP